MISGGGALKWDFTVRANISSSLALSIIDEMNHSVELRLVL